MSRQERLTNFRILFKIFILFVGRCFGAAVCISPFMQKVPGSKPGQVSQFVFTSFSFGKKSFLQDKMVQIFGCSF